MTQFSRIGAYFVPDKHLGKWWIMTKRQFWKHLKLATGQNRKVHSQQAERSGYESTQVKHDYGKCAKCDKSLFGNSLVLVCDQCYTFIK